MCQIKHSQVEVFLVQENSNSEYTCNMFIYHFRSALSEYIKAESKLMQCAGGLSHIEDLLAV